MKLSFLGLIAVSVFLLVLAQTIAKPVTFQKRGVTDVDLDAIKEKVSNLKTQDVATAYGGVISSSAIKFQKLIFPSLDNLNIDQLMQKASKNPMDLIQDFMVLGFFT
jgi:hypothetical protein